MDAPAVSLERVEKRYGASVILHPTTLHVARGARLALVGPSGSGKSTILRLTMGLVTPDEGRVLVGGEAMTPASALRLRRAMGYVIQEGGLFPHLTARANVTLVARHLARDLAWDDARIDARTEELRALVELPQNALDRYPAELSGGQRQRVGLMRALMLEPRILLLDEPLGALDPISRARLRRELQPIFARLDMTVLLVTHDMAEAEMLAAELVVVDAGRIVQRGTAAELRASPAAAIVRELVAAGGA